jgi:predicted HTH domain antitoxin
MKTLTIQIPEEANEKEIKMAVAALLFDKRLLTAGQAADYAGITKRVFLETVGKFGVSIFNYPASELADDVKNA